MPEHIVVHHSITPRDQDPNRAEQGINNTHKERFNFKSSLGLYVGYQYIIYGNGELRQYRKDTEPGAHTKEQSMNFKSIGICLTGDYDTELPSEAQVITLTKFLKDKSKQFNIKSIRPHRFYAGYKSCYGNRLKDDWASSLTKGSMNPNVVIYKNGSEYQVGIKMTSPEGFAQKLVETGCYDLIGTDGKPDFVKINNIAHVL